MKKIVFALALIAGLATPAVANGIRPGDPAETQKVEAAREAVVPYAELKAVIDRWNTITDVRNHSTPAAEFDATVAVSAKTSSAVSAAQVARLNRKRAEFDKQAAIATKGMNDMCAVLSGC